MPIVSMLWLFAPPVFRTSTAMPEKPSSTQARTPSAGGDLYPEIRSSPKNVHGESPADDNVRKLIPAVKKEQANLLDASVKTGSLLAVRLVANEDSKAVLQKKAK